ncbi:MAG: hypothetical protein R6V03_08605 [Kiritimatiellia bacterium]
MKKKTFFPLIIANLVCVLALGLVWCGCEDDEDTDTGDLGEYSATERAAIGEQYLTVDPNAGSVNVEGGTLVFTVEGGKGPYSWEVTDSLVGTIEGQADGEQAIYTSISLGENCVLVTDSLGGVGDALVNGTAADISIEPEEITLNNNGDQAVLTAFGGVRPYTWRVVTPGIGNFEGSATDTGDSVTYERSGGGTNLVVVEGYHRRTFTATISQP